MFNYIMFEHRGCWLEVFFWGGREEDVEGGGAVLSAPPERSANKNVK